MTECIYLNSDTLCLNAEVVECAAVDNDQYAVRMKSTVLHPQGGGQPSDIGWIGGVPVIDVRQEQGEVVHYLMEPVPLGPNAVQVDESMRRLHSRLHSAGHLIGHVVEQLGWRPIKAHHWPGESQVVFCATESARPVDLAEIELRCIQLIARDLPRRVSIRDDGYREVGFGDIQAYPCGGTHVRSLGEVHGVLILSSKTKKNQLSIQYDVIPSF
ncbi:hypothetical protein GCM10011352_05820 [Marinobacterium zhoushanense]|uniref:Threonyl/alanyl tRNA synthetase SAD domain-containing protein n=1 Tax=Marinobacterium zhoushanense TaxID=1679163 RepID=A0ABQ1K497_9GAMM|nr:alanyl-tRNA editing protein [Marinobacterium zhoushanense]GGB82834.1 hypothetical protein GCM10011352_05820 [Marinobacterium zhoushanense]